MENTIDSLYKETDRINIRPFSLQYAEDMFYALTPKICEFLRILPAKNIEETKEFIMSSMQKVKEQETAQVVILDKDDEFIGQMGALDLETKTPELGFWLKESARHKGYGTAAMKELIEWANLNVDFDYLRYLVAQKNIGSRGVAEKLGLTLQVDEEGNEIVFQEKTRDPNKILDSVEYRFHKK